MKESICKCGNAFKQYNSLERYCSYTCKKEYGKPNSIKLKSFRAIKPRSQKRIEQDKIYSELRKEFLSKPENKICFIKSCNREANTIEHRAGRWGKNYLDTSTWAGCCLEHNLELENNSELSKEYQLSKITGKPKN